MSVPVLFGRYFEILLLLVINDDLYYAVSLLLNVMLLCFSHFYFIFQFFFRFFPFSKGSR